MVAFGDGDPELAGHEIDGLPVKTPSMVAEANADDVILIASTMHDSAIREELESLGCATLVPVGYLNLRLPDLFPAREYEGSWAAAANPGNLAAIQSVHELLADGESRHVYYGCLSFYLSLEKRHLEAIRSDNTMYFDPTVYHLGDDEVVVDGGAFTGDTLDVFLTACANNFRAYYAFEPDPSSYRALAQAAARDPRRVTAVAAGLGSLSERQRLSGTARADSRLLSDEEPGGDVIDIVSLDEYFHDRPAPSLIKMDIEGAEAAALLGCSGILSESRPVLAVSAYHYPTDIWKLPLLIDQLMPGSRLFLRHYGGEIDDTVCYSTPRP